MMAPPTVRSGGGITKGKASAIAHRNKRKFAETSVAAEDLPPVDEALAETMRELIFGNGGSMDLGTFMRSFAGTKKSQLEGHVEVAMVQGKAMVSTPTWWTPTGEQAVRAQEARAAAEAGAEEKKRLRNEKKALDGTVTAEIDEETQLKMSNYVLGSGGSVDLGQFMRNFGGFKRAQVEEMFDLSKTGRDKNGRDTFAVMIKGTLGDVSLHSTMNKESSRRSGRARGGRDSPYGAEAVLVPLSEEQVAEIHTLLVQNGGSYDLGRLSRNYPGVKKAQMEAHFVVTMDGGKAMLNVM